MFAGGKTMVKLLVIIDRERRRALLFERAEADIFAATALQFYPTANNVLHSNAVFNLIKKVLRKGHKRILR